MLSTTFVASGMLLWLTSCRCQGSHDAKRLYDDLISSGKYNKLIRPVSNNTDRLTVKLGIRLSQLIDVDEKNQIMTTNIWLRQEWEDLKLQWKPSEYGNVERLYVPSTEIWLPDIVLYNKYVHCLNGKPKGMIWKDFRLHWNPEEYGGLKFLQLPPKELWTPDIVLYNNADGVFEVGFMSNVIVHHNGMMEWDPPAIYRSKCMINVEFFPYDIQVCYLEFGSWTYYGDQVNIVHIANKSNHQGITAYGIDVDFEDNTEWDILGVPAMIDIQNFHCCNRSFIIPHMKFCIRMRRKTPPYTVNLIMPCIAHSILTFLVFYLPSESGEKITMSLTVLLSLTVFILLLQEMVPPNSMVVPLIGKYLLFVLLLVTLSIVATVIVLNVHFRSPSTDVMSLWVRRCFLDIFPRLLLMRKPIPEKRVAYTPMADESEDAVPRTRTARLFSCDMTYNSALSMFMEAADDQVSSNQKMQLIRYNQEAIDAIKGINFIAEHLNSEQETEMVCEDWKYVSLVLDRIFFVLFTAASFAAALGIILQAPTLYNDELPLSQLNDSNYASQQGHCFM